MCHILVVQKMSKKSRGGPKMGLFKELALVDWSTVGRRAALILILGAVACALAVMVGG